MLFLDQNFFKAANHPVHILDKNGQISPSSFIPFCSFGDDMKIMGREINEFHDPVCDSFEAKIRNEQLCYEVDLDKFKDMDKIKEQLESGLVLILDYNIDRQSKMYNPNKSSDIVNGVHHIFLNTISKLYFVFEQPSSEKIILLRFCGLTRGRTI